MGERMRKISLRCLALLVPLLAVCCLPVAAAARRSHFSDVPAGHWAYDAVNELADLGILLGYPAAPRTPAHLSRPAAPTPGAGRRQDRGGVRRRPPAPRR
jgi:hypothetical protein